MTANKELFDKAIENITAGTDDSNEAWVKVIVGNETFHTFADRAQELYSLNSDAALGTLFQIGIETGIEYQKLIQAKEGPDAAADSVGA